MAKVIIQSQDLTDIADALREANVTDERYLPSEMPDAIMDAMIKFAPKKAVTGETIVIDDAEGVKPAEIKLYGKSSQTTYTGSQYLNIRSINLSGADDSFDNDDWITVRMENYGSTTKYLYLDFETNLSLPTDDKIHVACEVKNDSMLDLCVTDSTRGQIGETYNLFVRDGSGTEAGFYENWLPSKGDYTGCISLTGTWVSCPPESHDEITFRLSVMVETGAYIYVYEPYVGNKPSPNLNYPQEIVSVGDKGSVEQKFLGENVWDTDVFPRGGYNGITRELVNGKIHFYGTATASGNFRFINPNTVRYGESGKVTLSVQNIKGTFNKVVVSSHKDGVWTTIGELNKNNGYTSVFELGDYDIIPYVLYENGVTYDTYLDFVINYGETALPFEPYSEQSVIYQTPNGLPGIPLGQTIPGVIKNSPIHMGGVYYDGEQYWIGNTKENGKNVQRIGEYIFTGSETFSKRGFTHVDAYQANIPESNVGNPNILLPALCTQYLYGRTNDRVGIFNIMGHGYVSFCFAEYGTTTVDDIKNTFQNIYEKADEPVTVYYILAEPIITDLTDEEKEQYKSIKMNSPYTIVTNNAGAIQKVTYLPLIESEVGE